MEPTTGTDLRIERIRAHVKVQDLAAALGWHPSKLYRVERAHHVPAGDAQAYVAALATCSTNRTPKEAA